MEIVSFSQKTTVKVFIHKLSTKVSFLNTIFEKILEHDTDKIYILNIY